LVSIAGTAERAAYIRAVTDKARQAMKLTWLIILGVCFLVGSIAAIVGGVIWMLLPFVGQ